MSVCIVTLSFVFVLCVFFSPHTFGGLYVWRAIYIWRAIYSWRYEGRAEIILQVESVSDTRVCRFSLKGKRRWVGHGWFAIQWEKLRGSNPTRPMCSPRRNACGAVSRPLLGGTLCLLSCFLTPSALPSNPACLPHSVSSSPSNIVSAPPQPPLGAGLLITRGKRGLSNS